MEQKIFLADNGFEFLKEYFKELYGSLGSYDNILNRYLNGIDFSTTNRVIYSIEDIPLVSNDDIHNMIQYENGKKSLIDDFIKKYEQAKSNGKLDENNYLYLAAKLGVVPYVCPDSDSIYSNLLSPELLSENDIEVMKKGIQEHPNIVAVMVDMLFHGFRDETLVRILDKDRNVWHQGNCVNYFRGESAYYGKSIASMFRTKDNHILTREEIIIKMMKITDFSLILEKIPYISEWPFGNVFYPGIAQHYGIPTSYIDITKNIEVAIFFACTKWDRDNNCWKPLSKEDFSLDGKREYITKAGGHPGYGVIFRAPADINNFCIAGCNENRPLLTPVYPMGYQPFLRCEKQSAYYISTSKNYDLYRDPTFEKHRFRLTEELCEWIFNKMNKGADIYPKDISGDCSDIIASLNEKKEYSESALDLVLKNWDIYNEKDYLIKKFDELGFKIKDKLDFDNDELINSLEQTFINNNGYEFFKQKNCFYKPQFCI